jgi:hypothetical protein
MEEATHTKAKKMRRRDKRGKREKFCQGVAGAKLRYLTEKRAKSAAMGLILGSAESNDRKKRINIYECKLCGGWHVGHRNPHHVDKDVSE